MRATQARPALAFLSSLSSAYVLAAELVVPGADQLNGTWTYQGCYTDVGRTINQASMSDNSMTIEKCLAFCNGQGYPYGGAEYFSECYCGNQLHKDAVEVNATDCTTACSGNKTEACGGPSRLTLFHNAFIKGPQPNVGIADWTHIGCFTEGTGGRALTYGAPLSSDQINAANCTSACQAAGYILAGTEYGGECYCGNTLENNATQADYGCMMDCNGNSSEICGGSNRLNVYDFNMLFPIADSTNDTTTTLSSMSSTLVSQTSSSTLPPAATTSIAASSSLPATTSTVAADPPAVTTSTAVSSNSPATTSAADSSDSPAVSSTTTSSIPAVSTSTAASSVSASSAPALKSVEVTTTSTSSSATPSPTAPYQPSTVANYNFFGCQTEATNIRALSLFTYADDTMTLESCQTFCNDKGTTYFGVEYGRECYCGNKFETGSVSAPASDCSMLCPGNKFEYCGNGNRLSVYVKNGTAIVSSSTTTATTAVGTSTSTAAPVATGFPEGWTDQGCWQDGPNGRIMPTFQAPDNKQLTQQSCAELCDSNGYTVSGTEYYTQCFCSNAIYNGGVAGKDTTKCSTPCSGDSTQMCGGPSYLSVVSKGTPQTFQPPAPQKDGLNGTWTYQGCVEDNIDQTRTLPWKIELIGTNTPEQCLGMCAEFGYAAGGMEYGEECYCGDPSDVVASTAQIKPESECAIVCAGNASVICGDGNRLSMYYWTGTTPLYTFDYPQGNDAGSYSNLVGGVVTPLMTMQSITGKVTFLEKGGTGAANSTGAYELDLSQVGDFDAAWKTMHIKTDVFCSAGLVLPDKAGRQLTIGGWSLDSTYGVRLYTPDGSDGVKGPNDWEENVNTLKLQRGRWYPSAMLMANGSILVVGGEIGSNDKAEPSLEILGPGSGPYINMDWLARTDPNNLYPFLAVLPGGGIFVAYWNEARILDEVTFETTTILPNMPGSVSDPLGGRTYPLEGTAVLLPQYAPFSDPLGVLLCGGSDTHSEALDNCVSTYPEAANPTWTLERMPSKRVMSCMAPLPDGTFLIANGAKEGVAGFGLADDPNLNALLYDPSKPIGSRISIMANTTVARLYHSEAITLLDGRVLITGSDPQDGKHPEEIRVEVFTPPYLTSSKPRPSFTITNKEWSYGEQITFQLGSAAAGNIQVSLLGAVSSTHGNSMGARTLFPAVSCAGTTCTVTAPPRVHICPAGWYQMYVLQDGIPAVGQFVRIGGDPAKLGNWPQVDGFTVPGV
ncbi:Uu.00g043950.m01.CDS01 [Anthostomella pinea]|uniref:Uu.00g043950.m01.CDS01 n=1 Tax=Anthostomella pinea TaxID=933095 RepID=A0AAI8YEA1_9PEZI|nr:Uu.00g043950.m01.CDS01 [Anthostomella pinea]